MKRFMHSTKIIVLLCSISIIGWTSTFVPAEQPSIAIAIHNHVNTTAEKQAEQEIIDATSLKELEIDQVSTSLDCTITSIGSATFNHALRHPTTNRMHLINLKNTIQQLINNPDLTNLLTNILATIKENESLLTVLLFSKDSLYSTETQEAIPVPPMSSVNSILESLLGKGAPSLPIDRIRTIKNPILANLAFFGVTLADIATMGIPALWSFYYLKETLKKGSLLAPAGLFALLWAGGKDFLQRHRTSGMVKDHLNALFTFVEQLRKINTLLTQHTDLIELFPSLALIKTFVEKPQELSENIKQIQSYQPGFFSSLLPSNTWGTYNRVQEEQQTMQKIFKAIGLLDFVLSLKTLYEKGKKQNAPFCFATYTEPDHITLDLQSAWHPLIDPKKVVTNGLTLGDQHHNTKIILTGPNKGKSTTLKMVALAALLAQTITIVPAAHAQLPIFDYLGVYLNPLTGTTTNSPSESQLEINRMQENLTAIKMLAPHQKSLTVFDRLFRTEELAKQYNYSIARGLTEFNNNISIIATNNKHLTTLEQEADGIFTNYQIDVTFKISPGLSSCTHEVPFPEAFLGR